MNLLETVNARGLFWAPKKGFLTHVAVTLQACI